MHCVLISNCEQRALPRTRALIDRYAQRIGDRAWATRMTDAGLNELHLALRKRATRQTSVACYRSDATMGLRLIWIVGAHSSYDKNGWFAVATQHKKKEFPVPFRHASLIAEIAGYAHDLGKASARFQSKLAASAAGHAGQQADVIRHEWLSAWLLSTMLGSAHDKALTPEILEQAWSQMRDRETVVGDPWMSPPMPTAFKDAMDAALWSVCTHHGAVGGILSNRDGVNGSCHIKTQSGQSVDLSTKFQHFILAQQGFAAGTSEDAKRWIALLHRTERVRKRMGGIDRQSAYWEGVMLVARAALILADHRVSSRTFDGVRENGILYANTKESPKQPHPSKIRGKPVNAAKMPPRFLDQPLSWHLTEVGSLAAASVRMFTGEDLPTVSGDLMRAVMESRSQPGSRFAWQDAAVDAVSEISGGKLIFNVASTGAGKTLANLKMAFAMRQAGVRLSVAFNLRSLTTQTFRAFKRHVRGIDAAAFSRDFACLLGDRATIKTDFSSEDEDDVDAEDAFDLSASGHPVPPWLANIALDAQKNDKLAKLIASPILVSTMDWIVAAGEPGQQARHAKALIRVANSDLILDEVDSYDVRASVAVMRVVQTAATFGRNVIVSSATLSPTLAGGLVAAYAAGRRSFEAMFGKRPWSVAVTSDQFAPHVLHQPSDESAVQFYRGTMRSMGRMLSSQKVTKRYRVADVQTQADFGKTIAEQAMMLHAQHATTPTGLACRVSIGLVRVANVSTCMEVSEFLRQQGQFVVSAYHARDIAERRAWRESQLDRILDRGTDAWVDALREVAPWIQNATGHVRLIVVATPVEEVGRDHDFDWAIIEPSSMHSIIQTAGRVNRHRRSEITPGAYNVVLLNHNIKHLKSMGDPDQACFQRPGLEVIDRAAGKRTHRSHDVRELMRSSAGTEDGSDVLDAALVFDEDGRKACFAQDDEGAIATTIDHALRVLRREAGFETHFMMRDYPHKFPLREGSPTLRCIIDPSRHSFVYETKEDRHQEDGKVRWHDVPDSTWLCPRLADIDADKPESLLHCDVRVAPREIDVLWNGVLSTP